MRSGNLWLDLLTIVAWPAVSGGLWGAIASTSHVSTPVFVTVLLGIAAANLALCFVVLRLARRAA